MLWRSVAARVGRVRMHTRPPGGVPRGARGEQCPWHLITGGRRKVPRRPLMVNLFLRAPLQIRCSRSSSHALRWSRKRSDSAGCLRILISFQLRTWLEQVEQRNSPPAKPCGTAGRRSIERRWHEFIPETLNLSFFVSTDFKSCWKFVLELLFNRCTVMSFVISRQRRGNPVRVVPSTRYIRFLVRLAFRRPSRSWPLPRMHGRRKGEAGSWSPQEFQIWYFPIELLAQKDVLLVSSW